MGLGLVIALPLSFAQSYGPKPVQILVSAYEKFFRSIPELVILFLVFYGLPRVGIRIPAFTAFVVGFGLRSAAYQSQIFRGAILSVSSTQMRAARSMGMNNLQGFIHVVLPQAFRISLPPWANEFTIVLKDSSLAYAIGVTEMLRQGTYIIATHYEPMLIYLTVAAIYLIVTLTANKSLAYLEKRLALPGFEMREPIR